MEVLLADKITPTQANWNEVCLKGVEVMEEAARRPYITVADTGLSQKVFRARSFGR